MSFRIFTNKGVYPPSQKVTGLPVDARPPQLVGNCCGGWKCGERRVTLRSFSEGGYASAGSASSPRRGIPSGATALAVGLHILLLIGLILLPWNLALSSQRSEDASPDEWERANYIKGIPFFPQEDYYCGPASLASVLNFYGLEIDQEEIASKVFIPKLKGSLTIDLLNYAKIRGFKAKFYKGTLEDLKENIREGRPIILFLNLGNTFFPVRHYLVAVGFNDDEGYVVTYSGRKKDKRYSYKDLLRAWRKTGFGTLQVLPPDRV